MKAVWISKEKHKEIKLLAARQGITMAALFDKMYQNWLEKVEQEANQQENLD